MVSLLLMFVGSLVFPIYLLVNLVFSYIYYLYCPLIIVVSKPSSTYWLRYYLLTSGTGQYTTTLYYYYTFLDIAQFIPMIQPSQHFRNGSHHASSVCFFVR
jgi:hypothetical protein